MPSILKASAVVVLALFVPGALAQPAADEPTTPNSALPDLPNAQLASPGGPSSPPALAEASAGRVSELTKQADATADPALRAELLSTAANEILAYQVAWACTCRFLSITVDRGAPPEGESRAALDRVDALLTAAGGAAKEAPSKPESAADPAITPESPPKSEPALETSRDLLREVETLQAFARALRVYLSNDADTDAVRAAASELSVLLEESDKRVVAAAALWQGCLRNRTSEPSRVLTLLAPALADPTPEGMPFALFARLLRCRVLAAEDGHAVALALLTQIDERCERWFTDDSDRANARRTIALVRMNILAAWYDRLTKPEDSAARQWCADRIEMLKTEYFSDGPPVILPIAPAVPMIAATAPVEPGEGS